MSNHKPFKPGDIVTTTEYYNRTVGYEQWMSKYYRILNAEYGGIPEGWRYDVCFVDDPPGKFVTRFWQDYIEFDFKGLVKRAVEKYNEQT